MGAFDDVADITLPDPSDPEGAAAFRKKWGWEAHEVVLIKGTIEVADQEYVTNLTAKAGKRGGDIQLQAGTGRFALLDRMIRDWHFLRNGQKVPVTRENIRRLPANYANPILEAIDKIANGMTEEEQEDFLAYANGHIVDSFEQTSPSLLK
jgi:hypothetical protein